jgi:hypothetical protein
MRPMRVRSTCGAMLLAQPERFVFGSALDGFRSVVASRTGVPDLDEKLEGGVQRPLMFDFAIADLMLLGPADQEVYLVEFRCRCAVVVARGQVIRRTGRFRLLCEHVSVRC